jgi:hypothetical protein
MARQRFVESESTARANAALLEAQALDIRALSAALAPEILDYTFQQDMLTKLESLSHSLPQIVRVGAGDDPVDFLKVAQELIGRQDAQLFSEEDMEAIRGRRDDIDRLLAPPEEAVTIAEDDTATGDVAGEERMEEIRQSVASEISPDQVISDAEAAAHTAGTNDEEQGDV